MDIRPLDSSHAEAYQQLRLQALKDYPEAFASSYEEEKEFSIETELPSLMMHLNVDKLLEWLLYYKNKK
ncbi:hypothetical protein [Cytobacillus sp. IB215316]|uniref:hypothetical protein n=1 Tax=Cytobacillus sp. IB215316 TaxID=3097354 RepID=UPI002A169F8A|nr:hypothetical protein [Cytobacillus sp. IB215316]MDX8361433.1 hypothetical protein [Cytobacillus sp. IB215316]